METPGSGHGRNMVQNFLHDIAVPPHVAMVTAAGLQHIHGSVHIYMIHTHDTRKSHILKCRDPVMVHETSWIVPPCPY